MNILLYSQYRYKYAAPQLVPLEIYRPTLGTDINMLLYSQYRYKYSEIFSVPI
jgi:hypothetical protein